MSIDALRSGYSRFYAQYFQESINLYQQLKDGQAPKTLVIGCSDSRLDPAIITQASPGDLFVVRNVANIVPAYNAAGTGAHGTGAAIEYAVRALKVEHIIVLGHGGCGGINALLNDNAGDFDFIRDWIMLAEVAKSRAQQKVDQNCQNDLQTCCERENITLSLQNLSGYPWIQEAILAKRLQLHGWYFTFHDGDLKEYNPNGDEYISINKKQDTDFKV